jgi:hypothetical protein
VVFEPGDVKEIPDFLRHTTRYDLSDEAQDERLYRRLTGQPQVTRRPLGPVRHLPPEPEIESDAFAAAANLTPRVTLPTTTQEREPHPTKPLVLALVGEPTRPPHFIPLLSVEVKGEDTTAVLRPSGGVGRAFLEGLAGRRFGLPTVDFVFGTTAMRSRLISIVRTFEGDEDRFTLVLGPHANQGDSMEMGTSLLSVDEIATLRARRILLNEATVETSGGRQARGGDSMVEALVQGLQSPLPVERSPLPQLYRTIGTNDKRYFLAAAKLTAVLWLRLSGTVAQVLELEMRFQGTDALVIHFRGTRGRVYTNREPEIIEVDGVCQLG